ncbi:MAG: hypothetical protein HN576_12025 [Bacteriovoracaceae bacterium]|jgi:anthranilate/para-aminobenzoate synthase component II|nr:hypothetical protein [Bacteriovoracaceae bacterium]
MYQAYVIDFNDSFTFNILSILQELNLSCNVISIEKLEENLSLLESEEKKIIIWGPGPKHPFEYKEFFPLISGLRKLKQNYHVGICLGHQILMILEGFSIKPAKNIIHGQNIEIQIPDWDACFDVNSIEKITKVQRYNSLAVETKKSTHLKCLSIDQEVMITAYPNGVSYQFHPESVGTSFPHLFFYSSINYLYNESDGRNTQNFRYL